MLHNNRILVALILAAGGLACLQTLRCEAFQGAYSLSGTKWTSSSSSHTASALSRLFPPSHSYTTTRQSSSSSSPTVLHMSSTAKKAPGTAKLDTPWEELGFEFRPTNSHVRLQYKDGEWMKPELVKVCTGCTDCRPFETDSERCPWPGKCTRCSLLVVSKKISHPNITRAPLIRLSYCPCFVASSILGVVLPKIGPFGCNVGRLPPSIMLAHTRIGALHQVAYWSNRPPLRPSLL
jgi:hypothetical protein